MSKIVNINAKIIKITKINPIYQELVNLNINEEVTSSLITILLISITLNNSPI